MARRLTDNITSRYFEAANQLTSKSARRKIVAYVESYDDVLFWRQALGRFENDKMYFEIMLPTRQRYINRGKKAAIANMLHATGPDMIACVDADYDYLAHRATPSSVRMIDNPFIFHTYVYSIENYQCYAPALHEVCVMVTLNDRDIFDFNAYLTAFSNIIYPLFVWNIWFHRGQHYQEFTMNDFNKVITLPDFTLRGWRQGLALLQKKVSTRLHQLESRHHADVKAVKDTARDLTTLGVTPDNTYLYIQGHHLFDHVVAPALRVVCNRLSAERQSEIERRAMNSTQQRAEMACYSASIEDVRTMLKKHTAYQQSEPFGKLLADLGGFLATPREDLVRQHEQMVRDVEAMEREHEQRKAQRQAAYT